MLPQESPRLGALFLLASGGPSQGCASGSFSALRPEHLSRARRGPSSFWLTGSQAQFQAGQLCGPGLEVRQSLTAEGHGGGGEELRSRPQEAKREPEEPGVRCLIPEPHPPAHGQSIQWISPPISHSSHNPIVSPLNLPAPSHVSLGTPPIRTM